MILRNNPFDKKACPQCETGRPESIYLIKLHGVWMRQIRWNMCNDCVDRAERSERREGIGRARKGQYT